MSDRQQLGRRETTMTDPKTQQRERGEPDELELDAQTVKDLDPNAESAEAVRGGACTYQTCGASCVAAGKTSETYAVA
jgi:hypothetical protein